ncbi:MAG: addiction module protein [Planctomycetes bacterium]|nr:addiction module protein [Planctomycetota bacterium]
MITEAYKEAILRMSKAERMELLEFISETFVDDLPDLSDAQKKLLDERLAEHHANPNEGEDVHVVMARLRARKE